jgi:membrane-bound ClpP family serine protease
MTALALVLLVLGLVLLVAEAHLATFGVLGVAGVAALVTGVVLAVVAAGSSVAVALALTLPMGAALLALVLVSTRKALSARHRAVRGGAEGLIGHVGVVRQSLDPIGQIQVDGELWRARRSWSEEDEPPPGEGDPVVVDHVKGLTLSVRRAEVWEVEP